MLNENDRFWTTKNCFHYLDIHLHCHHGVRIVFSAAERGSFNLFNENYLSINMQAYMSTTLTTRDLAMHLF